MAAAEGRAETEAGTGRRGGSDGLGWTGKCACGLDVGSGDHFTGTESFHVWGFIDVHLAFGVIPAKDAILCILTLILVSCTICPVPNRDFKFSRNS